MKHLKRIFESFDKNIIDDVEDILLPLSDINIPVAVSYIPSPVYHNLVKKDKFSITLGDEHADIDMIRIVPNEHKDEFLRLLDYMESKGYEFSSINFDYNGDIMILKSVHIGLGIDAISNQLFNGIDETNYLKIWFIRK